MTDPQADEIDQLVAQAESAQGDDGDGDDEQPTPAPKNTTRRRSRAKPKAVESVHELDAAEVLPSQLPEPEENVKTLSDLYVKYDVGQNPEFKVQIYRTWPKVHNGVQIDGMIDTWSEPMLEEQIHAEYGGGQYRVTVVGPNPKSPNLLRHYGSYKLKLSGPPNLERLPRAIQGTVASTTKTTGAQNNNPPPLAMQESPKLAEAALKMLSGAAQADREERRRLEDKLEAERREERERRAADAGSSVAAYQPIIEAERRRSDDVIRATQERLEAERKHYQDRAEAAQREAEETRRRVEQMERSRPSIGQELQALAQSGLFNRNDDGTRQVLEQVLQKHRDEVASLQQQHTDFIKSIREGHEQEKAALRAAHEREMSAEREAGRSREARVEERLTAEREERRRDQDRFRQQMEERDQQWKDRLEQSKALVENTWQARHGSELSSKDMRIDWLSGELDRLRSELAAEKAKSEDKGDVFAQLEKFKHLKGILGDFVDKPSTSSTPTSSGGIGMGGSDGWQQTLVEGLSERAPEILQAIMGGAGGAQAAPPAPPQYQEGQRVMTPQGPMIAVRDPASGQMRMAKEEDLIRYQQQLAQHQAQQQEQARTQGTQQAYDGPGSRQPTAHKPKPAHSVTPNFADGLPKRRPPWEGGGTEEEPHVPPPPQEPPPLPRMSTRTEQPAQEEHMELSSMERQGLKMIATEVEKAIMEAAEADEFVQQMLKKYPTEALQGIIGGYSDRQIAQAIRQLFPQSAGATPLGQEFVGEAFAKLRVALA